MPPRWQGNDKAAEPIAIPEGAAGQKAQDVSEDDDAAVESLNPFARIWRAYNNVLHERPIW